MKRQSTPRAAHVTKIISRRPPRIRSSNGLSNGAMTANGAIVMIRYRSTFSRDWPGDTEKNSEPASETVRQTSPQMLAACVIASRAKGVGSLKRESIGPVRRGRRGGRRGGGAVAMAEATLSVTARRFACGRQSRRVHAPFLRRQFGCHMSSVAFPLQLRGCQHLQRASGNRRGGRELLCNFPVRSVGRVPPP